MTTGVSTAAGGDTVPAAESRERKQPSKLFPSLCQHFEPGQRLTVLEIGPAMPATVAFFSQFRCKIHFLDLYSEPAVRRSPQDDEAFDLQSEFRDLLEFPAGTRFDLCLFWDFLNYLEPAALSAFCMALQPWLTADTRAHGFALLNADSELKHLQYSVQRADQFNVSVPERLQLPVYPLPQAKFQKLLTGLAVDRSVLLRDGRLETLFRVKPDG